MLNGIFWDALKILLWIKVLVLYILINCTCFSVERSLNSLPYLQIVNCISIFLVFYIQIRTCICLLLNFLYKIDKILGNLTTILYSLNFLRSSWELRYILNSRLVIIRNVSKLFCHISFLRRIKTF